ncbi:MAG: glycerophosphodiester phosphodiesterase [Firmicutes bacterium]|jgi:glycerophosphoryl diester phosphodiesterase|nr:glycerophosphodiester phosphodiesterase [Bacillota bacterium]
MLVLAHRGYSGKAPENTMAAFQMALEVNADGLELDVHLSKDGEVVVCHDGTLDRTTNGTGLIEDYSFSELQEFDAGSWFSQEYKGERIPSLRQVCELVKDRDILFNVELKAGLGFESLCEKVAQLLDEYDLHERTIISSFNHYSLVYFKNIRPSVRTGILYSAGLYEPWEYAKRLGATALHSSQYAIVPEIVAEAQKHGMMVNPYTVDRPEDIERMKTAKVDCIITNQPERVQSMIS